MTLDELKAEAGDVETEVIDISEEVDDDTDDVDASLEENLMEACQKIDQLLGIMEQIVIVPKGRVIKRLPRHFQDMMEEAHEFLEEIEYERESETEEAA